MVTALFVAAQHPLGLDLQLRNLRWAIDEPKRIVVFTFKGRFRTELYPDVEFVEVDANPRRYYCFHTHSVGPWLYKHAAEIVVMSELDTFFTRKINTDIDEVRRTGHIYVGPMSHWYDIGQNGRKIMARAWEGGLIIHSKKLLLAHDMGILQGQPFVNELLLSKVKQHNLKFIIGDKGYDYGEKHPSGQVYGDNYTALNIVSYLMGYKIKHGHYLSHVKGPETIHREEPAWYNNIDDHHQATLLKHREKGPGTVFHLFILGKASLQTLIKNSVYLKEHYWSDVAGLLTHGAEWMPPDIFARLKQAARIINGIC